MCLDNAVGLIIYSSFLKLNKLFLFSIFYFAKSLLKFPTFYLEKFNVNKKIEWYFISRMIFSNFKLFFK